MAEAAEEVIESKGARPYMLAPKAAAELKSYAKAGCFKCRGTGVSGWVRKGFAAKVCGCAREKVEDAQRRALAVQEKLKAEMASVRKNGRTLDGKLAICRFVESAHKGRPCLKCSQSAWHPIHRPPPGSGRFRLALFVLTSLVMRFVFRR